MKHKAILFDFIGVLLKKKDGYKQEKLVQEIDDKIGQITDDRIFKSEIISNYGFSEKELDKIIAKTSEKYEPFQPLWDMLPELQNKYALAIINNGTALTIPIFRSKYPIDKYFKYFISSAIEGVKKPDKEIYLLTANRLGLKPKECIYMDDLYINVEGAAKLGMTTVYWETHEKGFQEFLKLIKNH